MALTELQLPTKAVFFGKLQAAATQMDQLMSKWKSIAEFIGKIDTSDLDSMGVDVGQVRTDLTDFRIMISETITLYEGGAVAPTNAPNGIVDKIRSM